MIHTFRFHDLNIVLDVESGALHLIDADAFAVLSALERGDDPYACAGLARGEVEEILNEFAALRDQGLIDTPEQEARPWPAAASSSRCACTWRTTATCAANTVCRHGRIPRRAHAHAGLRRPRGDRFSHGAQRRAGGIWRWTCSAASR